MSPITVFYAGMVCGEFTHDNFLLFRTTCGQEIYNGAYVYVLFGRQWFRMDSTPLLLEDVPKNLRTLVLLLT